MRPSPLVIEIKAPFAGRVIALSTDVNDCRLILRRLARRKRQEAKRVLDPATAAIIRTEVDRFEQLLALLPPRRQTNLRGTSLPPRRP